MSELISRKPISAVDLFCGAGGLTHGLILEGIEVRAGVDLDPSCKYPFEHNNGSSIFIERDVSQLRGRDLLPFFREGEWRLLAGCAPCQPFSTYSQGPRNSGDEQWKLLYGFARLVEEARPDVVTMENVIKLVGHKVFTDFVSQLQRHGYQATHYEVDCARYGAPQKRRRLVLFASLHGAVEIVPPTHEESEFETVRRTIEGIESIEAGGTSQRDPLHCASRLSEINLRRICASRQGGTWRDWDEGLRTECHRKKTGKTYPSVYGRMSWDELSPTITTQCYGYGNGRFGHPEQNRAISLREAALLQTFPPDYDFVEPKSQIHFKKVGRLIGNAVPVLLARAIARSIIEHLEKREACGESPMTSSV